jgi:plastocyanin
MRGGFVRGRGLACVMALGLLALGGCDEGEKASAADTKGKAAEKGPSAPTGRQTFRVRVDGPSAVKVESYVFGTYFPAALTARPGDTIVFENVSSHDIHTVTFGLKRDRSNSPLPETKTVQANPAVFGPCFTDTDPTADLEACPAPPPASPPSYAGLGYWNSGVFFPAGAPAPMPTKVTVKLARTIAAGSYPYACVLHPGMAGAVDVVAADSDRLSPAEVTKAGDEELAQAKTRAEAVDDEPATAVNEVVAGWGDDLVAVDRFSPSKISVKAGDTVTWNGSSPFMPHTVSFESPFKDPSEPDAFRPAGAKAGSSYTSGVAHSGIFGPAPYYPTSTFSLRFDRAGSYHYVCILHPGMDGTVEVS